jgi:hypothetical protein
MLSCNGSSHMQELQPKGSFLAEAGGHTRRRRPRPGRRAKRTTQRTVPSHHQFATRAICCVPLRRRRRRSRRQGRRIFFDSGGRFLDSGVFRRRRRRSRRQGRHIFFDCGGRFLDSGVFRDDGGILGKQASTNHDGVFEPHRMDVNAGNEDEILTAASCLKRQGTPCEKEEKMEQ